MFIPVFFIRTVHLTEAESLGYFRTTRTPPISPDYIIPKTRSNGRRAPQTILYTFALPESHPTVITPLWSLNNSSAAPHHARRCRSRQGRKRTRGDEGFVIWMDYWSIFLRLVLCTLCTSASKKKAPRGGRGAYLGYYNTYRLLYSKWLAWCEFFFFSGSIPLNDRKLGI
jgi:hypothetical protein